MIKTRYLSKVILAIVSASINIGNSLAILKDLKDKQAQLELSKKEYPNLKFEDYYELITKTKATHKANCLILKSLFKSL